MKTNVKRTIGFLGAVLLATQLNGASGTTVYPFPGSSSSFEQAMPVTSDQVGVDQLLRKISANAIRAANHAEQLESYTRTGRMSTESHAAELTGAKEAINAMGADLRELQALRASALPWQQLVIDRIEPALVALADNTSDGITRLNAERGRMPTAEYREAVANMAAYAGHARNVIAVNLDYAAAREKLNDLDGFVLEPIARASATPETFSTKASKSLEERVRRELLRLPYYGVFDHLTFQVDGDRVTLGGDVSWPVLKADAERVVNTVEGVAAVTNDVKVLPLSPNDDRLRLSAYWAIYGHSALAPYRLNPHPPIRIIVENGHVTLKGIVSSEMHSTIAHLQANSVPGAFSVTNNLQIGG